MVFILKFKGLPPLSGKTAVWLVICVSTYVCLLIQIMRVLAAFAGSMTTIVTQLERQANVRNMATARLARIKYILLWKGKNGNINRLIGCNSSTNCYFTKNKHLFSSYIYFDAIIFDHSSLNTKWVPIPRSPNQLYVFASQESPSNYPACLVKNDDFFNITFTYRFDSDVVWKFFVVRNLNGDIVAPNFTVQWNTTKHPIHSRIKNVLKGKTKAAAWIINDCKTINVKDQYLIELQQKLLSFSLRIDMFGDCTKRTCDEDGDCEAMILKNYYFYIAFENSLDDDYVTREVLHGYDNFAVPIVYGGADYNRFLPPGSYIDARRFQPYNLAKSVDSVMKTPHMHEAFFSWTNLYTIDSNYTAYNPVCNLCAAINSQKARDGPAKKNFTLWWNNAIGIKTCLPREFWMRSHRKTIA